MFINNLFYFLPEFLLIFYLCLLLAISVCLKNYLKQNEVVLSITDLSIVGLSFYLIALFGKNETSLTISNFVLKENTTTLLLKVFIILATLVFFIICKYYFKTKSTIAFEIPLVILFSLFGIITVINSNDLLLTYLALEMQSLSIYALVASNTRSNLSTEAGLKYFILGSFISGFLLYGISLIYLMTGTTNLSTIQLILLSTNSNLIILGLSLIVAGLIFKLSAAPLHNWTPDVFDGAPTIITLFIATIPKIAIIYLTINLLHSTFYNLSQYWTALLFITAIASLITGCLGGLYQNKLKRLLAYSTINNVGFILLGLALNTKGGTGIALFYVGIYIILNIGVFVILILFTKNKINKELIYIRELSEIFLTHPILGLTLALNIFSLVGIPPLAGFFSKFFILNMLILNNHTPIALFALFMSVITSFYYIRLIKLLYFNKENWNNTFYKFNESILLVVYFVTIVNICLILDADFVLQLINTCMVY